MQPRNRPWWFTLSLATVALFLLAACASGSEEEEEDPPAEEIAPPTTACQPPSCTEYTVTERDFFLQVAEQKVEKGAQISKNVKAGKVRFVLNNRGRFTHNFHVVGQGVDAKTKNIGAGKDGWLEVDLAPGTYELSCPLSNHADRGMRGALTVAP